MNAAWGDLPPSARHLSRYVDLLITEADPHWTLAGAPIPFWQRVGRGQYPNPRDLIPMARAGVPFGYDELIVGGNLNPDDWYALISELRVPSGISIEQLARPELLPVLDRLAALGSPYLYLFPQWYLKGEQGATMDEPAWQSIRQLRQRGLLNGRCCPLYTVTNRPDLGGDYAAASVNRGWRGGKMVNLVRAAAAAQCWNAGTWGANYRALDCPTLLRDDPMVQLDEVFEIAVWAGA